MTIDTAQRYLKAMAKVEKLADKIYAISYIMSILTEFMDEPNPLETYPIGTIGKIISHDILLITSYLDDFVPTVSVSIDLDAMGNNLSGSFRAPFGPLSACFRVVKTRINTYNHWQCKETFLRFG